ncbi:unnamed protein product [Owenia fusiformis]|uniref:Phosphodiesterase n=1 Tax=Owenia fusiformis TaxID=6347 RepID=A0A8S4NSD4_OWEFU|nr:unnamed protein product [Owenia fusiformis]
MSKEKKKVEEFLQKNPHFLKEWIRENASPELKAELSDELKVNEPVIQYDSSARNSITQCMFKSYVEGKRSKKISVQKDISALQSMNEKELFMELIRDVANELDVNVLCHKILVNVSMLTKCDRGSLFLARGPKENRFLVSKLFDVTQTSTIQESIHTADNEIKVPFGVGIAGCVAETKTMINITDAYEDPRFNKEVDKKTGYRTHSVLCMPICNHDGDVIGVAQIINKTNGNHQFNDDDIEVFKNYLTFCGIGLTNAQLFEMSVLEYKRNQMLLKMARSIFEEQSNLDNLVQKIMLESQDLLKCERCSVYIIDDTMEGDIVFEKAFDLFACDKENIKNPSTKDLESWNNAEIARHVATTGEILNIPDIEVDAKWGKNQKVMNDYPEFKTRSLLCLPIYSSEHKVIGVAQVINKINNQPFNNNDINIFEAFGIFCGLGICNTQMYEEAVKLMAKQSVALEVLSYHATAQQEETMKLKKAVIPKASKYNLYGFDFSDFPLSDDDTVKGTIRMFLETDIMSQFHVPYEVLCRWILSVKKNYRPVTYHNWRHAFNVAQTMFTMLYTGKIKKVFTELEVFGLLVACLCHDLDHRGTNNAFQSKSDSPLAMLYGTSTMEHHHFDHCIMILNSEGNNIFQHLNPEDYRKVIKVLESAILSTDLALYFKKRGGFEKLVSSGERKWEDDNSKELLRGMMMTACDVSAITKPWEVQQQVAELVSAEFFEQGDLEKEHFDAGPIAMMDRDKKDELPKMQVGFIDGICMPVYKTFAQMEKNLSPLLHGCENNRQQWQNLADKVTESERTKNGDPPPQQTNSSPAEVVADNNNKEGVTDKKKLTKKKSTTCIMV